MTSFEEALAVTTVPERAAARPSHPSGWEPGIAWDGTAGTLTTAPLETEPDPALWKELIADWDLNPETVEIVGPVQFRGWDSNVGDGVIKRMRYYRASVQLRESTIDRADVDALIAEIGKRKPRKKATTVADVEHSLLVLLSDWQVGKGEADGSAGSVGRIITALDKLVDRLADFKRLGRMPETVYLLGLGDLVEGCSGHYCVSADTPILTRDLRWVPAGKLDVGDKLYSFEDELIGGQRSYAEAEVLANHVEWMDSVRVTFSDGRELVCTPEHPILAHRGKNLKRWVSAGDPNIIGMDVSTHLRPWDELRTYDAGWLAGMFDGEGSFSANSSKRAKLVLQCAQRGGPVWDRMIRLLREGGFDLGIDERDNGVNAVRIRGGYGETMRFLGQYRPGRLLEKLEFPAMMPREAVTVVSVENAGEQPIARLGTSTHTYIANGIPSHNSMQAFQTDLDRREQARVVRRLILRYVDTIAALVPRLVCVAVPGNHGENRNGSGKAYTTFTDNDDLAVFEQVAEILSANDERYGHCSVMLADSLSTAFDASGAVIGLAHMHQGRSGANPKQKVENWWKGHTMGRGLVGDADILCTGHYHHLMVSEALGRTWVQAPALDPGSAWYEEATGQHSPPGLLTFSVGECHGPRKWDDMKVL